MKKKLKILAIILTAFTAIKNVYADEYNILQQEYYSTESFSGIGTGGPYFYTNFENFISDNTNKQIFDTLYNNIMTNYNSYREEYPYYSLGVIITSKKDNEFDLDCIELYMQVSTTKKYLDFRQPDMTGESYKFMEYYYNETYYNNISFEGGITSPGIENLPLYTDPSFRALYTGFNTGWIPSNAFETNIEDEYLVSRLGAETTIKVYNNQENLIVDLNSNDELPFIYTEEMPYNPEEVGSYTEVNLDNYDYVLLSLKNYNQTQAFQTNLQVKGQIGITPIYNFGQTSKDSITGVQVQDRCNISYENYTSYPFYIIQSDLQNNAIYAVKECSQGSSFEFDNTVFNITYITEQNKNNPTITIGGKTYNVIPYEDLPSTATKNEENNYIPGESGSATDTGGLDGAIKNIQKRMSEIWNTFTYFTDFVGQLFSSLPKEVQTILLSAFIVGIIIGLIKIFIN